MVSNELLRTINDYKARIGEPFKITEEVIKHSGRDYVNALYLEALVTAPETTKAAILDRMYRGWTAFAAPVAATTWTCGGGGGRLLVWRPCAGSRASRGSAAGELGLAADVIVRISRWFHSIRSRYGVMNPDATFVVQSIWGNIEDLRRMPSVCHGRSRRGASVAAPVPVQAGRRPGRARLSQSRKLRPAGRRGSRYRRDGRMAS